MTAGLLRGARAHATPEEGPPARGLLHRARPAAFPRTPLLFILRSPAGLGVSERTAGPPPDRRAPPGPALSAPCCIPVTLATAQAPAPRPGAPATPPAASRHVPPRRRSAAGGREAGEAAHAQWAAGRGRRHHCPSTGSTRAPRWVWAAPRGAQVDLR